MLPFTDPVDENENVERLPAVMLPGADMVMLPPPLLIVLAVVEVTFRVLIDPLVLVIVILPPWVLIKDVVVMLRPAFSTSVRTGVVKTPGAKMVGVARIELFKMMSLAASSVRVALPD